MYDRKMQYQVGDTMMFLLYFFHYKVLDSWKFKQRKINVSTDRFYV